MAQSNFGGMRKEFNFESEKNLVDVVSKENEIKWAKREKKLRELAPDQDPKVTWEFLDQMGRDEIDGIDRTAVGIMAEAQRQVSASMAQKMDDIYFNALAGGSNVKFTGTPKSSGKMIKFNRIKEIK